MHRAHAPFQEKEKKEKRKTQRECRLCGTCDEGTLHRVSGVIKSWKGEISLARTTGADTGLALWPSKI